MWSDKFIYFLLICCCFGSLIDGKGEDCKADSDCEVESSVCKSGSCVCPNGYVMISDMTQCLPESNGYGSPCVDSVQCSAVLLSGGKCINETCSCASGYHYFKGRCWKTAGIGDKCSHNENCFVDFDFEASYCTDKKVCTCSKGYYQREYSSCRPISKSPGDPCAITLDCHYVDSYCRKNRTCGFNNETNDVYPDPQPLPLPINGSSSVIGHNCKSDSDCKAVKNAHCNEIGKCSCSSGFFEASDSQCYPEIGTSCTSNSDCVGWFMTCKKPENVCDCQEGYVAEANNHNCTKLSRDIGWSCLEDRWCAIFGPGGVCVDKKCQCSKSSHFIESQMFCWISKSVGGECDQTYDCGDGDGNSEVCKDGKCVCLTGFHSSTDNSTCRQDGKKVGDPCVENNDCIYSHSACDVTHKECACQSGYMVKDEQCVAGVGGHCDDKTNCFADGSSCNSTTHECTCKKSFVSSQNYSTCLPYASHYLSNCIESQQCSQLLGSHSVCNEQKKCACMTGYHNLNDYCYLDVKLYQTCSATPECQKYNLYAECRNELCQCKFGHKPDAFNSTCSGGRWQILPTSPILLIFIIVLLLNS